MEIIFTAYSTEKIWNISIAMIQFHVILQNICNTVLVIDVSVVDLIKKELF